MTGKTLGRYELGRELARGGMGVVYRAFDPKHRRNVAIKIVQEDDSSPLRCDRFLREIRIAAKLQHPNILPIHDSGEAEGVLYYVMPLVQGDSLADRLRAHGPLPIAEALRIACDIAEALAHAHSQGVVHRDIKPANVLLSSGRAVVADFGLAVALETREHEKLTRTGVAMGTPSYMSPEQARGDELDGRSDLYSLGCLLYEMLTGAPPFVGTAAAVLTGHLLKTPPGIRSSRNDVPESLALAVARVLSKSPDGRFNSGSDFIEALTDESEEETQVRLADGNRASKSSARTVSARRSVLIAGLGAAALIALAAAFSIFSPSPEVSIDPVVAVLSFENLTGDPALDHVGTGTAHALVSSLSTLPGVTTISRASTVEFGADSHGVRELARILGASFVVRGVVQSAAGRLQITARLVRPDESIVWGSSYEGVSDDLFDLQRRVSRGLSDALQLSVGPVERERLEEPPTRDKDAYAEYSQGRAFLERPDIQENAARAAALFERAVERDPNFAMAHAGLAEARWSIYRDTGERMWTELARTAAEDARRLDPTHPAVRYALAVIYDGLGFADEAIEELDQALELQPRYDDAHRMRGRLLAQKGLLDEAITAVKTAIDLRPGFWGHYQELGRLYLRSGRYAEAQQVLQRLTELQPDSAWGYQMLGMAYHLQDKLDEAVIQYRRAIDAGASPAALSNLGVIHYRQGDYQAAAEAFEASLELDEDMVGYRNLGDAYGKLSRSDDARLAYERSANLARQALSVNPNSARSLSTLGLCEAKLERHGEARRHAERARELEPQNPDVLHRLAVVHTLAGRADEALEALARAVDYGYSTSEIKQDDDLQALRGDERFRSLIQK